MFSPYSPAFIRSAGTFSVLVLAAAGVAAGVLLAVVPARFALVSLCDPDEHAPNPTTKRAITPNITRLFIGLFVGLLWRGPFLSSLLFISILPSCPKFDWQHTGREINGRLRRRILRRGAFCFRGPRD